MKSLRGKDYAKTNVLTCRIDETIGEIQKRLQDVDEEICVVVNSDKVVLGLLYKDHLEGNLQITAEEVMETAPRSYRLNVEKEKILNYMHRNDIDAVLVTTPDGVLFGVLLKHILEQAE